MTAPDSQSRQREGVRIACAVARDLGLSCDDPAVLVERSNLLVHLRPAPVVARVATRIGQMRPGVASLAREVAITRFLAAAGAPVVPPSREVDPGPLERGGLALAFFEYSPDSGEPADAQATGRALRACHEWDLACLVATARVHGTEVERAGRALAAHGATPRSELLDLLVVARAFQTTVWAALFARDGRRCAATSRRPWNSSALAERAARYSRAFRASVSQNSRRSSSRVAAIS